MKPYNNEPCKWKRLAKHCRNTKVNCCCNIQTKENENKNDIDVQNGIWLQAQRLIGSCQEMCICRFLAVKAKTYSLEVRTTAQRQSYGYPVAVDVDSGQFPLHITS